MIDYIKGEIAELTPSYVVIELGGIGYFINITLPTFSVLGNQTSTKLFVYEVIRGCTFVVWFPVTIGTSVVFTANIGVGYWCQHGSRHYVVVHCAGNSK